MNVKSTMSNAYSAAKKRRKTKKSFFSQYEKLEVELDSSFKTKWEHLKEEKELDFFIYQIYEDIVNQAMERIRICYLEENKIPFVINSFCRAWTKVIKWKYMKKEEEETDWGGDSEPATSPMDGWLSHVYWGHECLPPARRPAQRHRSHSPVSHKVEPEGGAELSRESGLLSSQERPPGDGSVGAARLPAPRSPGPRPARPGDLPPAEQQALESYRRRMVFVVPKVAKAFPFRSQVSVSLDERVAVSRPPPPARRHVLLRSMSDAAPRRPSSEQPAVQPFFSIKYDSLDDQTSILSDLK